MKTCSIVLQWLVVIALLGFVGYIGLRPPPQPDYAPETWKSWSGVTVLSYAGIARHDTPVYPSVKRLEAQLTALRDAGYRTVRPEDVRAFLDARAPLPDKALLLIFEGGRKEAFIRATPVLQRTGFTAVIAVPTTVMSQWGGFYLKRSDIRKIVRLPQWQVGSMGHRAITPLPGSGPEEEHRFLASRARDSGQPETADAFRDRIFGDYAQSARLLEEAADRPPQLYLYPFGEAGQSPGSDPLAEAANRDAVTRHFTLAFLGGANPFNGPGSDPWSLTRLRVPGDWQPNRLLDELAASRPRGYAQDGLGSSREWVFEREAEMRGDALRFRPGGVAWLRGTDGWADLDATAGLQPDAAGSGALYARYASPRSWLRVTVDAEGLRVQERVGGRLVTLCRRPPAPDAPGAQNTRLRIRNNRAWVWRNGQAVAENLPLAPATRSGRIGLGCDKGELSVSSFSARPLPSRWVLANSIRLIAEDQRDQMQAILPNWFRAGEQPAVAETAQQDLLRSAVAGIQTYPLLTGGAALDETAAGIWAEAIAAELTRADLKLLVSTLAVEGPALALASELRNRNFRVVHLLTPAEARAWGRTIAQASPDEILVVNGLGPEAEQTIAWLSHSIPASRLALREPDAEAFGPAIATVRLCDSPPEK